LFRPGQVVVKDYYAELPIALRVSGRYHDIGAFAADVSNLSRIVTLHNLNVLAPTGKDAAGGNLSMEATARTYRYLDALEVADQKKTAAKATAGAKK
jgi:type IV pilus assembly protein PilO